MSPVKKPIELRVSFGDDSTTALHESHHGSNTKYGEEDIKESTVFGTR